MFGGGGGFEGRVGAGGTGGEERGKLAAVARDGRSESVRRSTLPGESGVRRDWLDVGAAEEEEEVNEGEDSLSRKVTNSCDREPPWRKDVYMYIHSEHGIYIYTMYIYMYVTSIT